MNKILPFFLLITIFSGCEFVSNIIPDKGKVEKEEEKELSPYAQQVYDLMMQESTSLDDCKIWYKASKGSACYMSNLDWSQDQTLKNTVQFKKNFEQVLKDYGYKSGVDRIQGFAGVLEKMDADFDVVEFDIVNGEKVSKPKRLNQDNVKDLIDYYNTIADGCAKAIVDKSKESK